MTTIPDRILDNLSEYGVTDADARQRVGGWIADLEALRELDAVRKEVLHAEIRKLELRAESAENRVIELEKRLAGIKQIAAIAIPDDDHLCPSEILGMIEESESGPRQ